MKHVTYTYKLYTQSTSCLYPGGVCQEYHQSGRSCAFKTACCIDTIKKFIGRFDIPLVEVINKRLNVTDFGLKIAKAEVVILNELDAIEHELHAHPGLLTGKLKTSIVSTEKYIAPYFISDFIQQHPGIELNIDITNKNK